ncbi:neutral alpha-glucosidase AB [Diorhabda sublineata]|uniref:neutral alpha-glucosidase AB n=1 Tax=Diorhabda sublineata TaxID=1163346 RepID=UPI0024E10DDA|nr:neutral alpha-glucosidase AB [Diorhabda sublineata]
MAYLWWHIYVILSITLLVFAVDKSNFKTCDQSSFCRRLRGVKPGESKYELDLDQLEITDDSVEAKLLNTEAGVLFKFSLTAINGNIFRVQVDEASPLYPRFRPQFALNGELQVAKLKLIERNKDFVSVGYNRNKVKIHARPFKIDFFENDDLISVINGRGLFSFEHYRKKQEQAEDGGEIVEDPGSWEENFKSHHDSKPKGPSAVGVDVSFPGALRVYGLPEHADRLPLKTTRPGGTDPYRLYNLDVFEYELDSTMALYGAIPVVYAHSTKRTLGIFWHNAAETWVDVNNSKDGLVASIVNLVSGSSNDNNVDVHFMSESGIVDLFVLMGPTPKDAVKQYASLTGVHPLPQYYTLASHQSRWNYNDEDDVTTVVQNFDANDMPIDTMWLDIEYTNSKKYFTWDPIKFPHPETMINNLTATGRKLIVIIDPHIKRESGYFVHEESISNGYYVNNKDGAVYEGWCWPGSSSYLDFYKPETVEYYKNLYSLENFKGTTHDVNIWNDMNEPSVFNGPEITMPKDCIHHGGWEHRDVHNEYALSHTVATFLGLIQRSPNRRPFILTRGHFAGSQRYTAMWTGDNTADWSHLAISYPMCLSEALGGISFCGADIGGFFNNPDAELLQRWYQGAVWLPFYRAHAHIDTRRREPFLYSDDVKNRIRNALRLRYAHLPLWYTVFWQHETTGEPVIRPLFYHYPEDENVLDIDDELLVGDSVLAKAITEAGVSNVNVYLPGGDSELWYDIEDYKLYRGTGNHNIPVSLDKNLAFYRGGRIISRKDRPRRSSKVIHNDPYTLYVASDSNGKAGGYLYVDDKESYGYKKNEYLYVYFSFDGKVLSGVSVDKSDYPTTEWIEKVVILGPPEGIRGARLESGSLGVAELDVSYSKDERALVVRKPGVSVRERFTITLY